VLLEVLEPPKTPLVALDPGGIGPSGAPDPDAPSDESGDLQG
jgi:hypothetical protein